MKYSVVEVVARAGMSYYQNPEGRLLTHHRESFDDPKDALEYIEETDLKYTDEDEDGQLMVEITDA